MVKLRVIPKEEAQVTRRVPEPGPRRRRMNQCDEYIAAIQSAAPQATVFEGLDEPKNKFVLSLRAGLARHGLNGTVKAMRNRDEVRVWLSDDASEPVLTQKRSPGQPRRDLVTA